MKRYQKVLIVLTCIGVMIFTSVIAGRQTTRAVYLWDSTCEEQLAELKKDSFVLELSEKAGLTHVFYVRGCRFGYIKTQYLTDIFHKTIIID